MSFEYTPIDDFPPPYEFTAPLASGHKVSHNVYFLGEGPPVVIIQELPGIGKETLRLADKLVEAGFKVFLPHLFGPLGRKCTSGNLIRVFCMRKEFSVFRKGQSSPIVDWLRALCRKVKADENAKGVGVIGMCLTGNFAISLMGDESVLAAVASQPATPLGHQKALDISEQEIEATKKRIDETAPMLAFRFEKDFTVQKAKFNCIHDTFNEEGKERIRLRTLPGRRHSVLTLHFVDKAGHPTREALKEVIEYFNRQLK